MKICNDELRAADAAFEAALAAVSCRPEAGVHVIYTETRDGEPWEFRARPAAYREPITAAA